MPIFLCSHPPLLFPEFSTPVFQASSCGSARAVGLEAGSVTQSGKLSTWKPGLSPFRSWTGI